MIDKMSKIRVLQVNAANFGKGGISTTIFRLMENMDDSNIQFVFLTDKDVADEHIDKIRKYGGSIERTPEFTNKINQNWLKYKYLKRSLEKNEYDIVHINGDNALSLFPYIFAAKCCKKCKIVVHAHTTGFNTDNVFVRYIKAWLNKCFKQITLSGTDLKIACSHEAAEFMFSTRDTKNVHIMKNGLISQEYKFVQEKRAMLRAKMDADSKMVIGHIGRFTYAKNHEFLIDLFSEIKRKKENSELWLIGDGQGEDAIRKKVHEKGLDNDVKFLGVTHNIQDYLCGMDIMVFPSRYEGLPLVLVEAQVNDLPIICSDVISNDTFFSNNIVRCSLKHSYSEWIKAIEECFQMNRMRKDMTAETKRAGFDMKDIAAGIRKLYYGILD